MHIYTYMSEKAMAPHSSTLAWKIPWTEEPGGLQSMGSQRVTHNWAAPLSLSTFTFHFHALKKEMATHSSVLAWRIPGTGAWWAAVCGVAQSWTLLKRLSSSTHICICIRISYVICQFLVRLCVLWEKKPLYSSFIHPRTLASITCWVWHQWAFVSLNWIKSQVK